MKHHIEHAPYAIALTLLSCALVALYSDDPVMQLQCLALASIFASFTAFIVIAVMDEHGEKAAMAVIATFVGMIAFNDFGAGVLIMICAAAILHISKAYAASQTELEKAVEDDYPPEE